MNKRLDCGTFKGKCFLALASLWTWMMLGNWISAEAATITWLNVNGGNWNSATNWSPSQVPGTNDAAVITSSGTYTVTLPGNAQVAGLQVGGGSGVQTLTVINSTLTFPTGTIGANGALNLNNSTLNGALTINGSSSFTNSILGNSSSLTVGSNGILTLGGGSDYFYGLLTNAGTVNWTGTATLSVYNNYNSATQIGGIVNLPGAVFNVQNDQAMNNNGAAYFNNAGTLQKLAGTNTTSLYVPFTNSGQLNVASGTMALLGNGNSTGTISGAGSISVSAGTLMVSGTVPNLILSGGGFVTGIGASIGNLTCSGGTLQGTNVLTGSANWTSGTLGSTSSLTVASSAVLTFGGNGTAYLNGVLSNAGTVNWTGTVSIAVYNNYNNSNQIGGIVNLPGAVFNIQNDQLMYNNGSAYLNNSGTLQKLAGTNITTISPYFTNSGQLNVASGTLALAGNGNSTGTIIGGGSVSVSAGTLTVKGTVPNLILSGGGFITGVGASIGNLTCSGGTLQGTNVLTGSANWTSGTLGSTSSLTVASSAVLTFGGSGTAYLNGVLTNAGTVNWTGTVSIAVYNNYNNSNQIGGIVNLPGAVFNIQNDQLMYNNGSAYFNNAGTLQKLAGTNTTTLSPFFTNSSQLNVASGTVALAGGGNLAGTVSGSGLVSVPSGTLAVNGTVANLMLSGGTLIGGGTIGNLTWTSGTLQGTNMTLTGQGNLTGGSFGNSSTFTVASNAVLNISGSSTPSLFGVLTNAGTVNWTATANLQIYNNYVNASQTGGIVNQRGALFNVQNDQSLIGNGSPYFNNLGTFQKSGSNITTVNVAFNNTGALGLSVYGPTNFSKLAFSGNVVLGGSLNLNLKNGYSPAVGDSFTLLTYGSESNVFSAVSLLPLRPAWETNLLTYGATSFTLTIGSIYKLAFTSSPPSTNAAGAVFAPVVVQIQNLNGTALATNGVPVTLALSSGSGALSGATNRNTDATGQVTFTNLSLNLVGTKVLTASSPPWVTPASSSVVIVPGPAAQLRLTSSPGSPQRQGYTFSPAPTAQVLDAYGNVLSNSTASITASSSSSGGGTLGGTLGANANGTNGSATFGNLHYTLGNQGQAESVVLYFNSPGLAATNSAFMVDFAAGILTLTNGNSLVQIDPNSQNGVFSWVVDGTQHLFQQWFWLRLTNGPQVSLDQLGTPLGISSTPTNATITYLPPALAVTLAFTLQGGAAGSHGSSLVESISLQNTNASPVTLHLYAYTDFDVGGNGAGDTVSFPATNTVVQQSNPLTATQSVQPSPNHRQAGWYSLVLDTISSTTPATLSDSILPNQPGDHTFAYQWDLTVPGGQTLVLNLANSIQTQPAALSIALSGPNVLLYWPVAGTGNLKLQSNGSLNGGGWQNVTNNPTPVGANYQVTLPLSGSERLFRLH